MSQTNVPAWVTIGLLPAINVLVAFLVSALLFIYIDINPLDAIKVMWTGAFGYAEGFGYTSTTPRALSSLALPLRWLIMLACSISG